PILRVPPPQRTPGPPASPVAAAGAASVSAGGLLLFAAVGAVGWFAADVGTFGQAMSVSALAWLLGNGAGLTGGGFTVNAVPLGFMLAFGYALYRVGRGLTRGTAVDSL